MRWKCRKMITLTNKRTIPIYTYTNNLLKSEKRSNAQKKTFNIPSLKRSPEKYKILRSQVARQLSKAHTKRLKRQIQIHYFHKIAIIFLKSRNILIHWFLYIYVLSLNVSLLLHDFLCLRICFFLSEFSVTFVGMLRCFCVIDLLYKITHIGMSVFSLVLFPLLREYW